MNNDDLRNLINGIGAICEMAGVLRDNLIRNGFTREEACRMVTSVLSEAFRAPNSNNG